MPKYCNNIDLPLRPDQKEKLDRKREKLQRVMERVRKKFGQYLTESELRVLSQALAKHPNAHERLLRDRNLRSAISLLGADLQFHGAAQVVRKLASEGAPMAS